MSSHHIVKEKQEPALVVEHLANVEEDFLGQLLEWTPTLVTHDNCAMHLIERGIKIDVLISNEETFTAQSYVSVLRDTQKTFLEQSLSYLLSRAYPAVNIISEHLPLYLFAFYWKKINMVVFQQKKKIFPVTSGFRKWKPAHESIFIYAPEGSFKTKGLKKQAGELYTTTTDGFYEITFSDRPYILIAELF